MKTNQNNIEYAPVTLDFVTVGVEFCSFLEKDELPSSKEWTTTILKILPLLYIKATLIPTMEVFDEDFLPTYVTEHDYARVSNKISSLLGEDNVYLDVFIEDMKYSDKPISSFISEDIADIYQDIRNFISVYQYGLEDNMINALNVCIENFQTYWGQKLVNVLRALHYLAYKASNETDNTHIDDLGEEDDLWG